jgi:hypothetical protein
VRGFEEERGREKVRGSSRLTVISCAAVYPLAFYVSILAFTMWVEKNNKRITTTSLISHLPRPSHRLFGICWLGSLNYLLLFTIMMWLSERAPRALDEYKVQSAQPAEM